MNASNKIAVANAQDVTAIAYAELVEHVGHLIYAIDRSYFTDKLLTTSAYITPLRAYVKPGASL